MKEFESIVRHLSTSEGPSVLATLANVEGSSYRRPGARMLVPSDGGRIGSISGGCLEEDVLERSRSVARSGRPELVTYDTTTENDLVWGVGLGCHGVIRVLLEPVAPRPAWAAAALENLGAGRPTDLDVVWTGPEASMGTRMARDPREGPAPGVFRHRIPPPPSLALFGAGDDARPLARLALEMGWRVAVADPRPAFATAGRFPGAAVVVHAPAEELAARVAPREGSLAVVMTHHYRHDVPLLRSLLPMPLAYLGLLGPRQRAERILGDIAKLGVEVTPDMLARFHAPVGLDLGSEGPEAVALSIIAEMASVLSGRDAHPLRERSLPIHA